MSDPPDMSRSGRWCVRLLTALVLVLVTAGCTAPDDSSDSAAEDGATSAGSDQETAPEPETRGGERTEQPEREEPEAEEPEAEEPRAAPHPVSVRALIETEYTGRGLRVGRVLGEFEGYTEYAVTYLSQDLRISGMNVPSGRGPFPVLVLNHGYIEPGIYMTGQGLAREQNYLARQGYVVLHTDYRSHAGSDGDPDVDYELRLPYAVDVINAVRAVKRSDLPYLDGDRVGLLGRSMGGNVTLNALVARPGLVDAATVYASTSSLAADNWRQFYQPSTDRAGVNARIRRTYGLPRQSPRFWRAASPRPYFDRVTAPVLLHHGTLDDSCPISWSQDTLGALQDADKRAQLVTYEGEGHTMYAQWQRSMQRTTTFFDRHLR
ncbi:MAG TPA: alpha/beta fold hydrolase [Nocardioidaceae bacterium]|nr:alpha/beta fold hydrolase [Nocardioidaceae bacterium]